MGKEPYRIIIAGGRDFDDYGLLQSKCLPMFDEENKKVAEGLTLFSKYFRNLRD